MIGSASVSRPGRDLNAFGIVKKEQLRNRVVHDSAPLHDALEALVIMYNIVFFRFEAFCIDRSRRLFMERLIVAKLPDCPVTYSVFFPGFESRSL